MNDSKLIKARLKFENACGKVEAKLQKRISFGEVSVDYYPGDGICAEVNAKVVPLREIPARGKLDEEWWDKHAILGVKMSKLKVHKIGDLCFDFKMGKDVGIDFYLKSNVDTVIEEKDRAIEFAKALTLKDIEIIKEKDKEIAELKEQLESEKASRYADSVDAGMENRRLTRALWLARLRSLRHFSVLAYFQTIRAKGKESNMDFDEMAYRINLACVKCRMKA